MNTKSKTALISSMAGILMLGMGGAAHAGKDGMKHSAADFNKDGMVTESELVTFVRMHFMTMDKNNNHMIEDDEWNAYWYFE